MNGMNKVLQRLLIFFVGIPVVVALIIPNFLNKIFFHALVLFFAIAASWELCNILDEKYSKKFKTLIIILSSSLPISTFFCGLFNIGYEMITLIFIVDLIVLFICEIFFRQDFTNSNSKISKAILNIFYSGFLASYLCRLTTFEYSTILICFFVITVFLSDSAAWLFGMTFGKNNRGIIAASPKKSIAGFIGAFLATIALAFLFYYFLGKTYFPKVSLCNWICVCVIITAISIIGDLIESVFKRSSGCKDSGNIILGRGGALDSIDSMFLAAPIYYYLIYYFI